MPSPLLRHSLSVAVLRKKYETGDQTEEKPRTSELVSFRKTRLAALTKKHLQTSDSSVEQDSFSRKERADALDHYLQADAAWGFLRDRRTQQTFLSIKTEDLQGDSRELQDKVKKCATPEDVEQRIQPLKTELRDTKTKCNKLQEDYKKLQAKVKTLCEKNTTMKKERKQFEHRLTKKASGTWKEATEEITRLSSRMKTFEITDVKEEEEDAETDKASGSVENETKAKIARLRARIDAAESARRERLSRRKSFIVCR